MDLLQCPMSEPLGGRPRGALAVALLLGCLMPVLAWPATTAGEGPIVIRAARMLDVERGRIVKDAVIVVEGGTIRMVNPDPVPAAGRTIVYVAPPPDLASASRRAMRPSSSLMLVLH